MRLSRLILMIMIALIVGATFVHSEDDPAEFQLTAAQKTMLLQKLDRQWRQLFGPGLELKKGASVVEAAGFALDAAAAGYSRERLENALYWIGRNIDRKRNSATYGNIFWYHGAKTVNDLNAVEFCLRQTLPIWILYRDRLSPKAEAALREIFDFGIEAIKRHQVKLSYTNIILMKIANLILLGEHYGKPELARMGYGLFEEWLVYTYRHGLCEYLSPGYYVVDLQNLALIYRFTKEPRIRKMAAIALEYIWTDIAVNWYQPSQRLGGTHSRDYDRLYGHSNLEQLAAHIGLIDLGEERKALTSVLDLLSLVGPAAEIKDYLALLPRFVHQRWGEADHQRASHYIGRNFSVGSAESNYGNIDKTPLVINLGGGYHTPVINFFMDGREDYYGLKKNPVKSGHLKALHLRPFLTSVQNDGEVLFLAALKDDTQSNAAKLESMITLPSDAEIRLNHQRLEIDNYQSIWRVHPEANDKTTKFTAGSTDGRTAVRLIDRDQKEGIGVRRRFEVVPGKRYRLKVYYKGGGFSLYLNFHDRENNLIEKEYFKSIKPNPDRFVWSEITEQAPDGAAYGYAWIYSSKGGVTDVTVADVILETVDGERSGVIASGFDFREERRQRFAIPEGAVLFIKRGDAVAALCLLKALNISGKPIGFELVNDGLRYGAFRLTATHSKAKTGRRGVIVVWSYAADGIVDEAAFEDFRKKAMGVAYEVNIAGPIVGVKVAGITGEMELKADIAAERRILRRGMKPGLEDSLLAVNGMEIGKRILEKLELIQGLKE